MSERSPKNLQGFQLLDYCLIGFLAPICTILLVNSDSPIQRYLRKPPAAELVSPASASASLTPEKDITVLKDTALSVRSGSSFARIKDSAGLDPLSDQFFMLAFKVKFKKLPSVGHRQNIIEKYEAATFPYSGWSFGVSQLGTSFRPEFYWRGSEGKGGWYTFSDFKAEANRWYSFAVLARGENYASLFMETVASKPKFLGGVSLKDVKNPVSNSDLLLGAVREGEIAFHGDLGSVLIGFPEELPSTPEELSEYLAGGPDKIVEKLTNQELKLWVDSSGTDKSKFQRDIILNGSSSWLSKPSNPSSN